MNTIVTDQTFRREIFSAAVAPDMTFLPHDGLKQIPRTVS
jgi:hypothetical protein